MVLAEAKLRRPREAVPKLTFGIASTSDEPRTHGPLSRQEWDRVVASLELSPQQARIVGLIVDDMPDKQIARGMGLSVSTVRTYLTRIFQRTGTSDRVGLVLKVFACARELRER
jgi:DNA-binding CsgD family transcriptional regulator